jgi:thioredoxin 1
MLAPVLEKVAEELLGVARVCKVDIDEAQRAAATFKVTSVPTLILFKNGDQVGRIVGVQDHTQIVKFVQGKV